MTQGVLMNHRGAVGVGKDALSLIDAPEPTETWFPLKHSEVLETVENTLGSSGFAIANAQLSVSHEDKRFFGVLDIRSEVAEGVSLSVGIRNSCDKTFPIGFCCGTRTFVCDNLAFSAEIVISKKHTRFGEERFREGIAKAVSSLHQFRTVEAARIEKLQRRILQSHEADSIILRSGEKGITPSANGAMSVPVEATNRLEQLTGGLPKQPPYGYVDDEGAHWAFDFKQDRYVREGK
jgi:hypothetical protein